MAHLCVGTARLVEGRASAKAWQLQRRGRGRLQETRSFIPKLIQRAFPQDLPLRAGLGPISDTQRRIARAGRPRAPLVSGRAGVKASRSHVRAPYDRATHPTSLPVSLSHCQFVCACRMSPCRFCLAQDLLACCRHKERKIGQTGGESRAQTSGSQLTSMPGGHPGPGCCCLPTGHPASLTGKSLLGPPSRGHCWDRSPTMGFRDPRSPPPGSPETRKLTLVCGHLT